MMSMSPIPMQGSIQMKWDPKNLEIRTKSVEKTLEPLVTQVRMIANYMIIVGPPHPYINFNIFPLVYQELSLNMSFLN